MIESAWADERMQRFFRLFLICQSFLILNFITPPEFRAAERRRVSLAQGAMGAAGGMRGDATAPDSPPAPNPTCRVSGRGDGGNAAHESRRGMRSCAPTTPLLVAPSFCAAFSAAAQKRVGGAHEANPVSVAPHKQTSDSSNPTSVDECGCCWR